MSARAVHWAWEQRIKPATTKLVLMAMAEFANPESALCWPSMKAIEEMTGLNRKTVLSAIASLAKPREEGGLGVLTDTGNKMGRTMQIVVYRMSFDPLSVSVPKTGQLETVPFSDGKSPDFTSKESRKRDTEPTKEPSRESIPPSSDEEGHPHEDSGDDLFGGAIAIPDAPPLDEIVLESWHALKLAEPKIADVQFLDPARKVKIAKRAGDAVKARATAGIVSTPGEVWAEIFEAIRRSTFLCGRAPPGRDRTGPFKLNIDFVLRPPMFLKILEGGFDDDERSSANGFDAGTGRRYGPGEQATRSVLSRLQSSRERRARG